MSVPTADGAVRPIRRLIWRQTASDVTDGQLWDRFRTGCEEAAFETLVRRHGPMVLAVCRRVLRDQHDAEDAFQATFLILLRKAGSIARPELLGNWLFGVAYNTARNARVIRSRRTAAEIRAAELAAARQAAPAADPDPWLDHELSRLPDKYRVPVVLCCLHGESRETVARRLGCPEGTVSSRLGRARDLLRRRLERRGLTAVSVLSTLFAGGVADAGVSTSLITATVQTALNARAGSVAGPVLSLAEGAMRTMWLTRSKMALAAMLIAGLVAGTGLVAEQALAQKPAKPATAGAGDKPKPEVGPTVRGKLKAINSGDKTITVDVPKNDGTKASEEKTYKLSADVVVTIDESFTKEKPPPAGKLTDLSEGLDVTVQLSPDKSTAVAVHARGPVLHTSVASVDAGKGTMTVRIKAADGPMEQTLAVAKEAKIILTDGLTKEEKPREAALGDLAADTHIQVQLSVDRKTALGVRVMGTTLLGRVASVDVGNNTVTISLKEDGGLVDKTFTLVKDARIEGAKLNELQAGTNVSVTLSVFDKSQAAVVRVRND
jgi:RNA polymerase sigma factor (sigma-70 family)